MHPSVYGIPFSYFSVGNLSCQNRTEIDINCLCKSLQNEKTLEDGHIGSAVCVCNKEYVTGGKNVPPTVFRFSCVPSLDTYNV